ncbi:MAG: tryptophan--tRNA ligase [Candidatus Andersenbacteria bacterium]
MELPQQKRIFSGVQPSGVLHLGNYLGALKQWVALQEQNETFYCIVDEHAITVPYDPKQLQDRILDTTALYIAAGIDPERSIVFVQSHVPQHTELAWLLSTITPYGDLTRMTQFKDKSKKQSAGTTVGLFSYPMLMAADILLYQTQVVPVGDDQTQHIELTREVATRFNGRFGDHLTIPQAYVNPLVARIMSLSDPTKKMSKSDEPKTYIALTDEAETIRKKIGSAVTETEPVFSFSESGPAVQNLLHLYQALGDESPEAIEAAFSGKGYKEFKEALAERIITTLQPLQKRYQELRASDDDLRILLGRGQHRAQQVAAQTLTRVKEAMGLL